MKAHKGMKKILIIYLILSLIWCIHGVSALYQKRDWISGTATVTFIGLPQGTVFGDYTDINGTEHIEKALYIDYIYQGRHIVNEEYPLYGKSVRILYNLNTGEVDIDNTILHYISVISLIISITLLLIFRK